MRLWLWGSVCREGFVWMEANGSIVKLLIGKALCLEERVRDASAGKRLRSFKNKCVGRMNYPFNASLLSYPITYPNSCFS